MFEWWQQELLIVTADFPAVYLAIAFAQMLTVTVVYKLFHLIFLYTYIYIYIYIYIYVVHLISFQTLQALKIVIMLLLYILWDDKPIFMISDSNEQLQQQPEYTLLKPDCHSWWISKMQSGREDTLEERYAIKFCFEIGKYARDTYGMLKTAFRPSCMNRASAFKWNKRFNIFLNCSVRQTHVSLTRIITPSQSGSGSNGIKAVIYIPQSSRT